MKSINQNFNLVRLAIQEHIGKFIVSLLIFVYLSTALLIGLSLYQYYVSWLGFPLACLLAGGISTGAQLTRGSLVYFSQANPYTLSSTGHFVGGFFALALTCYSSYEVYYLMSENGVKLPGIISAIGVIGSGFLVEVYFLNELIKINTATLANDAQLLKEVEDEINLITKAKANQMVRKQELIKMKQEILNGTYKQTNSRVSSPVLTPGIIKQLIRDEIRETKKPSKPGKHEAPVMDIQLNGSANGVKNQ